jgi:hypothetical protein
MRIVHPRCRAASPARLFSRGGRRIPEVLGKSGNGEKWASREKMLDSYSEGR